MSLCLAQIEDGFYATLARASKAGEINPGLNLRAVARYLTSSLQGLLVIGKIRAEREVLMDVVDVVLRVLD